MTQKKTLQCEEEEKRMTNGDVNVTKVSNAHLDLFIFQFCEIGGLGDHPH
jgi:hypothetical protein